MTIILIKKHNGRGIGSIMNVRPDVGKRYIATGLAKIHFIDHAKQAPDRICCG